MDVGVPGGVQALCLGIIPGSFQGPYVVLEIEPSQVVCARDLTLYIDLTVYIATEMQVF